MNETFQVIGDEIYFARQYVGRFDGPGWVVRPAREAIDNGSWSEDQEEAIQAAWQEGYDEGRGELLDTDATNEELEERLRLYREKLDERDAEIADLLKKVARLEKRKK